MQEVTISKDTARKAKDVLMRSGDGNDPIMAVADAILKALAANNAADGIVQIVITRDETHRARRRSWH
jgi:hypothetical protein